MTHPSAAHRHPEAATAADTPTSRAEQRQLEDELERMLRRITTDLSELTMTRLLPRAKLLYELLHPETKHGGPRPKRKKQDAKFASWPSFAQHVAETRGVSKRTIQYRLTAAEKLATLDEGAERACLGTALANQLPILTRIAAIPSPQLQRDLVGLFDRSRKHAQAELIQYEAALGLSPPTQPKDCDEDGDGADDGDEFSGPGDSEKPECPDDGAAGAAESEQQANDQINGSTFEQGPEQDTELTSIMEALGVTTVSECLRTIQQLKASETEVHALRDQLRRADATNAKLKMDLARYEDCAPLDQIVARPFAEKTDGALDEEGARKPLSPEVVDVGGTRIARRSDDMHGLESRRVEHDDRGRHDTAPKAMSNDTAGSGLVTEAEFARLLALPPRNAAALRRLEGCPAQRVSRFWYWPLEQGQAWYWETENGRTRETRELDRIREIAGLIPWCGRDEDGPRDEFGAAHFGEPSLHAGQQLLEQYSGKAASPAIRAELHHLAKLVEEYAPQRVEGNVHAEKQQPGVVAVRVTDPMPHEMAS